jgi:nucleotide-binding universal stress UspA family protein
MTTNTPLRGELRERAASQPLTGAPEAHGPAPILVASDGTSSADPAFTAARLVAARTGADVQVLGAIEPMPTVLPATELLVPAAPTIVPPEIEAERAEQLSGRIEDQLRDLAGERAPWRTEVRRGEPASVIARAARESGAGLIITGLTRHGFLDRLLGGETPIHIVHQADAPVLVVSGNLERAPRRLVIAVDFTPASMLAAHVALDLFPEASKVYLVHVTPRFARNMVDVTEWERAYSAKVQLELDRARRELGRGEGVETVRLSGNAARELLDFASQVRAELIVAGCHRRGAMMRLLLGDVAAKLARGASMALLIVPETARRAWPRSGLGPRTVSLTDPATWASAIGELARRNAGRRVVLEIHDADLGAQAIVSAFPLAGAAYDARDDRIEIMLGDARGMRHLTHVVTGPRAVDIVRTGDGHDMALRVTQPSSQTVMMFTG